MSRLRRFFDLSGRDQRLLVRAGATIVLVRVAQWLVPFRTLRGWLGRAGGSARDGRGAPVERVGWAVETAGRYVPGATCLTEALAGEVLLRRAGHAAIVQVGVARSASGKLQAHAWTETDGRVIIGGAEAALYRALMGPNGSGPADPGPVASG